MKQYLIPAAGIVIVTLLLLAINRWTETSIVKDYAYLFIIAATLLGVWLARLLAKRNNDQ